MRSLASGEPYPPTDWSSTRRLNLRIRRAGCTFSRVAADVPRGRDDHVPYRGRRAAGTAQISGRTSRRSDAVAERRRDRCRPPASLSGYADGVRADAVYGLKMLRVHQQRGELVTRYLSRPNRHADARRRRSRRAWPCPSPRYGRHNCASAPSGGASQAAFCLMVGLLEQNVGADSGVLELPVVLDGGRGYIDVDAGGSRRSCALIAYISCPDALQYVLDRDC